MAISSSLPCVLRIVICGHLTANHSPEKVNRKYPSCEVSPYEAVTASPRNHPQIKTGALLIAYPARESRPNFHTFGQIVFRTARSGESFSPSRLGTDFR